MAAEPPPVLDTRTLPDLVAQLRDAARTALPAWTPPAEGDVGTALHRIFARFVEIALQRLNGVPDKTLLAFLDLMGVSPLPPAPARVPLVFTLAPGGPPALVPAGTRASAPASGARPEVVFETEQDLLVLPARLVAARTEDPVWDRASDLADLVGTPSTGNRSTGSQSMGAGPVARPVFVGAAPLGHVLHVGESETLIAARDVAASLGFRYRSDAPDEEVAAFLRSLVLSCDSGGVAGELIHSTVVTAEQTVYFGAAVPPVDPGVVSGVGLPAPVTSRWLRLSLPAPLPDAAVPAGLTLEPVGLDVEALVAPQALLAGTAPVDPSTDFLPFGERPQVGDTFLIRSDQAFVRPLTVSILFDVSGRPGAPTPDLALAWEYLGADGWSTVDTVTPSSPPAGTLTAKGAVNLTLPPVPVAEVGGQAGRWVRARVAAGGYGAPAEYVPVDSAKPALGFQLKAGTGALAPPRLRSVRLSYAARTVPRCLVQAGSWYAEPPGGAAFAPFPAPGQLPPAHADPDPALYLGFDGLAPQQPVALYVEVPAPAAGRPAPATAAGPGDPSGTGLRWEYFDGDRWRELTVFDGTRQFTVSGTVSLITPVDLAPLTRFEPVRRVWLRVRAPGNDPVDSPRVAGVHVNAVLATAAVTVADEILGSSDDQPEQAFRTGRQPVRPGQRLLVAEPEPLPHDEAAALAAEEGPDAVLARPDPAGGPDRIWVRWHEVPNLIGSGPGSRHYTVDRGTGTVRFGDGRRGMIPPRGTANVAISYRCGGGSAGNLGPGAVAQLATPVPGLAAVTNPVAADGGADAEPLAAARERGAHLLRHRDRAIATDDVEWLARQAAGTRIARAVCTSTVDRAAAATRDWLSVLLIPAGPGPTPRPTPGLISEVADYLTARSAVPLTAPGRISYVGPAYVQVTVEAEVVPRTLADAGQVTERMVTALDAFFHPVGGGPDGAGWPLGRPVYGSEVAQVLERVPGVSHVTRLALRPNQVQRRLRLTGSANPVTPARLPAGTAVRTADGLRAALLAQAVPAGVVLSRVDVVGFREGDRVTFALDLAVLAAPAAGRPIQVAVAGGRLATGFPRGSVVVAGGGRYRTRLARGLAPAAEPTAAARPLLDLQEVPPLAVGDRLTVLYPFPTEVGTVTADTPGTVLLTVDPVPAPAAGLPAGTIVTTVDGSVRAPLAADLPAGPDGRLDRLPLDDFGPGQPVLLGPPGEGPLFTALADAVTPVTDHVHLDPSVFAYSAGHRLRIAAS